MTKHASQDKKSSVGGDDVETDDVVVSMEQEKSMTMDFSKDGKCKPLGVETGKYDVVSMKARHEHWLVVSLDSESGEEEEEEEEEDVNGLPIVGHKMQPLTIFDYAVPAFLAPYASRYFENLRLERVRSQGPSTSPQDVVTSDRKGAHPHSCDGKRSRRARKRARFRY
ncbi:hypothetical protein L2E82_24476 [Cichorium intybus]|uniref:Uncharacterized protein n=1 Tax=Cichorium intybus TaxID=13427 RepID=A0ACB9E0H8_CICIN|nr:hypothetical protein L2E82_24476 [Cichorium intybus]